MGIPFGITIPPGSLTLTTANGSLVLANVNTINLGPYVPRFYYVDVDGKMYDAGASGEISYEQAVANGAV